MLAFLNVGYFLKKARRASAREGARAPEFSTLPVAFVREHHDARSSWEKVRTRGLDLSAYRDEVGFERIAEDLRVPYPSRA